MENKKYKIAIISPVPFYYHIPMYRSLSSSKDIDLKVMYCSDETLRGKEVNRMYRAKGKMVDVGDLLNGYDYTFIENYSPWPSYMIWPFGLINLGVWAEIKKGNYDAVVLQAWTNITWVVAFLACLQFKTPVLFMTDSNVSAESSKSTFKKFLRKVLLGEFLFERASGFLTSGTANEKFYAYYGVPERKMVRLPFSWGYGDLLQEAEKLKHKRVEMRKSFGVKDEDAVILYVGRLSQEKSPITLLEAYNKVARSNKKLFLVGDGPQRQDVEKLIKQFDIKNVHLAGFQSRDAVFNFYTMADFLVIPSKAETWGIVVSESACFSLPVISSDKVGASLDLVKDNYNGFIFPAGNTEELARKIEKMIDLPREEFLSFGKRSKELIVGWINSLDASSQIIKILTSIKHAKK